MNIIATPIALDPSLGPVVFLGGMNAMPMMYALEIRKAGVEVLYFVDAPQRDTLSRPENHFKQITYPYPEWIIELHLPSQILLPLFGRICARWLSRVIRRHSTQVPQAIFLNGFFMSLAPFFTSYGCAVIALAHGSDIDTWADKDKSVELAKTFGSRSIFKYVPEPISSRLIRRIVAIQFKGVKNCDVVMYFPRGFNERGDAVVDRLVEGGVVFVPRYDVSFEPLQGAKRGIEEKANKFVIFSGVRFLFSTFPDGNDGYNKGNDIIIEGISEFCLRHPHIEIEVHFVEKGEDVALAKKLCDRYGISDRVIWHKTMPFHNLLELYEQADVCFDQVGDHWIGAIGCYALWLGKPLIANDARATMAGIWPSNNPICHATSPKEVNIQLENLLFCEKRTTVSIASMDFAEKHLGPRFALDSLFKITRSKPMNAS